MKKVLRYEDNQEYWDRRWIEADHDADDFSNLTIYPIKYAEMVMTNRSQSAVELGAGLGRLVKHYHNAGFNITGLERSEVAAERLRTENPDLGVKAGDVRNLPYDDDQFDVVLAFGLFHNIEEGLDQALMETQRVLTPGGRFCISMRPNNIEMHFNEWYWRWKQRNRRHQQPKFHKWLVGESEFSRTLSQIGLNTKHVYRARNVSLLYRIPWLQAKSRDETERRSLGYRLNRVGQALDKLLVTLLPSQFCNVLVYIGSKGT